MDEPIEKQIDLRDYISVLIKRRWAIITFFSVVVLTVAVQTFTTIPIYNATARIIIEKENPNIVSIQEVITVDAAGTATDYYQTQYKIIESRTVAREVVRRLNLNNSPEFFPKPKNDIISQTKRWINFSLNYWKVQIKSLLRIETKKSDAPEVSEDDSPDFDPDSALVSSFIGRITVSPIRNSRLVDISAEAMDPAMAARMANELIQAYINQNLKTKLQATKNAVGWLNDQVAEERKKVETAENALLRYKEQHGIFTDFSQDAQRIASENLARLNARIIEAESKRVEAEMRYQQAIAVEKNPEMIDAVSEVLSNTLIRQIKKMEVDLYNRMSELSKKYGRHHPKMLAIDSELADLKKRKATEVKRVVASLRNTYKLAVAREKSLIQAMAKQKTKAQVLNKKAVQFGVLSRQVETSRYMYELLIKRFKETTLSGEIRTGNISIVDRAEVPRFPVKPRKKLNILLAVIVGLVMGIGLAFFLEYLDNTIKLPDEIKKHLKIPYLGPVPAFASEDSEDGYHGDLVMAHSPKSTASESFRGIRTGILFSAADTTPQTFLVTSASPSEGKTICAANLAITMAQAGSRVLLLDCDMRRPRIHKIFQTGRDIGISSVLVGKENVEDTIIPTGIKNLDMIPVGPSPPNPSEILGSKKMQQLLDSLRSNYTRIVIDSPPIMAVTDSVVLSQMVDGVIVIISSGDTPRPVVQNGVAQLNGVNARILGAVLNGIRTGRDGYYYNQYYSYYYGEDGVKKKKSRRRKKRTSPYSQEKGVTQNPKETNSKGATRYRL